MRSGRLFLGWTRKLKGLGALAGGLLLLTSVVAVARGQDCPQFRGPTGQGHADAKALPVKWDLVRDTRWKITVPGKGWSSPIVLGDRIVLTTAVPKEADSLNRQSLRTICLDAKTGETRWDVEVFTKEVGNQTQSHQKNSFASPTPITDGRSIFVHYGPDGTACLDLEGRIVWATQEVKYNPQHGGGGSPILSGNLLIFHCDGVEDPFVVALHRDSGRVAWRTQRPQSDSQRYSFATPLEITVDGKRQLISPASHMVCSYDPETGEELWRVKYPNKWSVVPRPVYAHGLVYICTGYDGPAELLAIRPTGHGEVTETHVVWRTDDQVPHNPSPLVVGDEIFLISDDGIASCRDAKTGTLHWRHRLGGNYSASPIYALGKIYLQSEQGVCTVIVASRDFEKLAVNDFEEQTLASFAVIDDALLVRTETQLYRIEQ